MGCLRLGDTLPKQSSREKTDPVPREGPGPSRILGISHVPQLLLPSAIHFSLHTAVHCSPPVELSERLKGIFCCCLQGCFFFYLNLVLLMVCPRAPLYKRSWKGDEL